jgi:hypothetical protein
MQFKEWLLFVESKEEKTLALELAGDALQELNSVIPQNQKDSDLLLLLAAYFYNKQKNLNQIKKDIQDYIALVKNNKMPLIKVNLQNKSPDKPFDDYLHWTQVIHGHQAEESYKKAKKFKPSDIDFQNEKPIKTSPDGKIRVYKSNSPQQCLILGRGQTFCISQPGNTMWKSYRDTKGSTFYFVYDDTREDELGIVVVDASNNGIELTDKINTTGETLDPFTGERTTDSNSYIEYLKEKGIDTSIFVNLPKTKEEIAEDEKLGEINEDLNWFIALSPTEKSNYIGRGHLLTDEQFNYLWNNKFSGLLEQYVKTGLQLSDYQIDKIASNVDLRKNYIYNRMIDQNNGNSINEKEFQYLNKEQMNNLSDDNVNDILFDTKNKDEMAKLIIQNKNKLSAPNIHSLLIYATNKNEIAELIGSENISKLTDADVYYLLRDAKNKDEMAKILGSENINKLRSYSVYELLDNAENKDEMAQIIIQNKKFLHDDDIANLVYQSSNNYKIKIAKLLGGKNINRLNDDSVENLLHSHFRSNATNKDEMAELILQYKEKLSNNDVARLLLYAINKEQIAEKLGKENINKLTDKNIYYLLNYAKDKDELKRILQQYGRI